MSNSKLYQKACEFMPGGVNSPARAFGGVGGEPVFIKRGEGCRMFDSDNKSYIDYVLSWGPLVLGHAHPHVVDAIHETAQNGTSFGAPTELETQLAELLVSQFKSIDMIRFVNSGTEATMSALRLARAHTGRAKIIKFAGNYHGHADMLLAQAGSSLATLSQSASAGVSENAVADTLIAPYNNLEAVKNLFENNRQQIAGIIVEPIAGNMGLVLPESEFLPGLRKLCDEHGALLIIDEVMTGFRAALPGAQTLYDVKPDITCLGKVIGGGLPVAAYGGRREVMHQVSPLGSMCQAGTLSGNPLGMASGLATLKGWLRENVFDNAAKRAEQLILGIREIAHSKGVLIQSAHVGTMFGFYFLKEPGQVKNFADAQRLVDTERYAKFFHAMLDQGYYFAPSAFEAGFVSAMHQPEDIAKTLKAIDKALA
ncbi:MAG: glutamate-1-semialdehyde 2,1-aminomutase [Deltaproteobacteria bacterium]|nr:glutamate-1-semialdehyde 2,1-aminomutase [Deltaproteobacteria bacterium]